MQWGNKGGASAALVPPKFIGKPRTSPREAPYLSQAYGLSWMFYGMLISSLFAGY